MLNMKVIAVDNLKDCFTKDKIYEFKDGVLIYDDGYSSFKYEELSEYKRFNETLGACIEPYIETIKENNNMMKNKPFTYGDLVRCIALSDENVENLVIGKRYRIDAITNIEGTIVYSLVDKDGNVVHTKADYIGYVTEKVQHPKIEMSSTYGEYKKDMVNPSHYKNGKIECIDALESATVGKTGIEAVCVANVIKYLWRYEDKNGLTDVKKAQWYLNKLIASMEEDNGVSNEDKFDIGDNSLTQKQIQFIAGLCKRLDIDRYNLPSTISPKANYKMLTEYEASFVIEKLCEI